MSGPKIDYAEIRRQERERIERIRRIRRDGADQINRMIKRILQAFEDYQKLTSSLFISKSKIDKVSKAKEESIKKLKEIERAFRNGTEQTDVAGLMNKANGIMMSFTNEMKEERQTADQIAATDAEFQERKHARERQAQIRQMKIQRLSAPEEKTDSNVSESDVKELTETFEDAITKFLSKPMTSSDTSAIFLIGQDLKEISVSDVSFDRKSKRIRRLYKEYQRITERISSKIEDMELLYEEYVKECFDLDSEPLALENFEGKEQLEKAITAARQAAEKKLSKDYIRRQIDEVMSNHGYDVVRSDMLQEMSEKGQVLYGLDDNTAIDVFVSDNSQVTMKVVGIGFDSDLSEKEDDRLLEEQGAFCQMHPQITKELEMRGVILHKTSHLPPDRKYNTKIQVRRNRDVQEQGRARRELKRQERRTMYME